MRILLVIASRDFRDEEYFIPCAAFEKAGFGIVTAGSRTGGAIGAQGGEADITHALKDIRAADFDALVFAGGGGSAEYFEDKQAHRLAREFDAAGKLVAAICIAPVILANAGVLSGRSATVWRSALDKTGPKALEKGGCALSRSHVERSGNIITADGPESASEFAKTIISALTA